MSRPPRIPLFRGKKNSDELLSGCVVAAMLILVWFLIMIFH